MSNLISFIQSRDKLRFSIHVHNLILFKSRYLRAFDVIFSVLLNHLFIGNPSIDKFVATQILLEYFSKTNLAPNALFSTYIVALSARYVIFNILQKLAK